MVGLEHAGHEDLLTLVHDHVTGLLGNLLQHLLVLGDADHHLAPQLLGLAATRQQLGHGGVEGPVALQLVSRHSVYTLSILLLLLLPEITIFCHILHNTAPSDQRHSRQQCEKVV